MIFVNLVTSRELTVSHAVLLVLSTNKLLNCFVTRGPSHASAQGPSAPWLRHWLQCTGQTISSQHSRSFGMYFNSFPLEDSTVVDRLVTSSLLGIWVTLADERPGCFSWVLMVVQLVLRGGWPAPGQCGPCLCRTPAVVKLSVRRQHGHWPVGRTDSAAVDWLVCRLVCWLPDVERM